VTGQKNFISIIFIIFLCIGVILSLLSLRSAVKVKEITRKNIKEVEGQLEQFKPVPTREEIIYLTANKGILENDYEGVKAVFDTPETKMPKDLPTTLQFKTILLNAHDECRELCFSNEVELSTSLGFDEYSKGVIPTSEELPDLVKELQIEKELIELLVKAKARKIEGIKFFKPIDTTISNLTIREFPIAFSIVLEEEGLVNTLYNLRISKFLFQVRDIKVVSGSAQDKEIMANMVLTVKVFL
jgi:hypothetical protein